MTRENPGRGIPGADALEVPARRFQIEMSVQVHVRGGGSRTLLETGMRKPVHDDMVARTDERFDHPIPGRPTGRIKHRVVELQEVGDDLLQLQGVFCIAGERG